MVADFSQIELRVCAIVAEDETMQRAYREGVDLNRLTAATAAGITIEEVTSEQRQAAKAINFGLIYGMSAATLVSYFWASYRVRMTLDQAERFRRAFFDLYRGIARWHQAVKRRGRLRPLPEPARGCFGIWGRKHQDGSSPTPVIPPFRVVPRRFCSRASPECLRNLKGTMREL